MITGSKDPDDIEYGYPKDWERMCDEELNAWLLSCSRAADEADVALMGSVGFDDDGENVDNASSSSDPLLIEAKCELDLSIRIES